MINIELSSDSDSSNEVYNIIIITTGRVLLIIVKVVIEKIGILILVIVKIIISSLIM